MFNGDRARKQTLVDYGFRIASALDNRPRRSRNFEHRINQACTCRLRPGRIADERPAARPVVNRLIRPTRLVDPQVEIRPVKGQVDDLLEEIRVPRRKNERVAGNYADEAHV